MSLKSKFLLLIIILPIFIYLYLLNPESVKVYFVKDKGILLPVIILSFIFFILGMLLSAVVIVLSDVKNIINDWKDRRLIKRASIAHNLYLEGVENILNGNMHKAMVLLNNSLAKDPGHTDTYIKISETYLMDNRLNEAEDILKKGLLANSLNSEILLKLVECYLTLDKRDTAYNLLGDYLKKEPKGLHAMKILRDMLIDDKRWQGALSPQEFLTAYAQKNGIDRFKKEVNLLNGIRYETAKVFYNEGIFDKTLEQIEKILNADDSFIPAYILKGNVLYKKGNVSSAVKVWERAYRRYRNIALFLQIEGLYIKESLPYRIIRLYKRTINFHPDDRNLMTFLARLYLKLEMIDEAIKELEMLLKEDEGTKYQYLLLAESYARRGRFEESAKSYKNALDASHFTPVFTCRICKFATGEWLDRCPNCRLWNTMDAEGL